MASFSGRSCESLTGLNGAGLYQRSTVILPRRHGVLRISHRESSLQCSAVTVRSFTEMPWIRNMLRALQYHQAEQLGSEYVATNASASGVQRWKVGAAIKDATWTALQIGLSLTGAAINLASRVVSEWQRKARAAQQQKQAIKETAAARQQVMDAQTQLRYEIQRKRLEVQGQDKAFVSMLHVLDRCHLDHDVKWALVQKHTADKAEFSERLQQLYNLAEASKDAVDTLLRPDASRKEINTFWKSPETVAIIAEEDKLKSLVFAQMLQASG